jgi:integrase
MGIKIRPYVKSVIHSPGCSKKRCGPTCTRELDGFEYDIRIEFPNKVKVRERKRVPLDSCKTRDADAWAKQRERELWIAGAPEEKKPGEMTVDELAAVWIKAREERDVSDDFARYYKRVIRPHLGGMRVCDVKRAHVAEVISGFRRLESRQGGPMSPGSVRQVHYAGYNLFEEAVQSEYVSANPFKTRVGDLPKLTDKDPAWRRTARFSPEEVVQLITEAAVPLARRVAWALQFLTGMRPGEASAVRWDDIDWSRKPLAELVVARAYSTKKKKLKSTKTGVTRYVPVHPVLAAILKDWHAVGWESWTGRQPTGADYVIPNKDGSPRSSERALTEFRLDLDNLKLRSRRLYDTRRTFISMAMDSGAHPTYTRHMTHAPPPGEFYKYFSGEWGKYCDAILCLRIPVADPIGEASRAR